MGEENRKAMYGIECYATGTLIVDWIERVEEVFNLNEETVDGQNVAFLLTQENRIVKGSMTAYFDCKCCSYVEGGKYYFGQSVQESYSRQQMRTE